MSTDPLHRPVVVGVDGSRAGANALHWAAMEARLRATPLLVVHAGDTEHPQEPDATVGVRTDIAVSYAEQLLADAIASVCEDCPSVQFESRVIAGHPAAALEELSRSASLLVLGTRGRNALTGLLLGSTSQRLAGRAECPTVLVSERELPADPRAPVVVGVSDSRYGRAALHLAGAEASLRGVELRAIRSMAETEYLIGPHRESRSSLQRWEDRQRALLDSCVAELRDSHPALKITAELVAEPAHLALVEAAQRAALLVAGRRREGATYLSALGPLASWLMHESPVPIVLTGATTR